MNPGYKGREEFGRIYNEVAVSTTRGTGAQKVQWLTITTTEFLCHGTIGLIVAPWKFDVLKTSMFSLLGQIFNNIKISTEQLSADRPST